MRKDDQGQTVCEGCGDEVTRLWAWGWGRPQLATCSRRHCQPRTDAGWVLAHDAAPTDD
jgi:hypothetical protein